ncbi:sister chromatid cohesion protein ctf8 [Diplodia corticola]|uniref:Sister chromatid cohesion protein ctf8 n=1 Tax=Diplodia corticola TaxID=236234 RepID=A0A1J9S0Z7_9PEZI|nr:sister chromatid cohesion protein ctf8 [Diplodia corticola]OJD33333.1 sister chromatid cohesion protein ctf8 [Diplodia corticola]
MPSVPLHPPSAPSATVLGVENPLPQLLQTPSGLAMLEIQGTIHSSAAQPDPDAVPSSDTHMPVGKLVFPHYSPNDPVENKAWMKRVHMYVGKHQRMTGEVKELPKPVAVIRRRPGTSEEDGQEELEIVDIVRHKIIFSSRPEPVSGS